MHLVVIHHWKQDDLEAAQTVAAALGKQVFDVRQRMTGGGPAVIASFAEAQRATIVAERLQQGNVPVLVIDTDKPNSKAAPLQIRQFRLTETALQIEDVNGRSEQLPYGEISLMLPAITLVGQSVKKTATTERKFSLGKTLMAGGIPMTKKVKQEVSIQSEERDELLWLQASGRLPLLFFRGTLDYTGLGAAMQMSRTLNFAHLKTELARRAPQALVDDRLLMRAGQAKLLGPSFDPDRNLHLACTILSRTLP